MTAIHCDQMIAPLLEPMAQLAWRYGPEMLPCGQVCEVRFFTDGSIMSSWMVDSPRGYRYTLQKHGLMR